LEKQKEQTKDDLQRAKNKADQLLGDYRQMCNEHFSLEKMNLDLRTEIEALKKKLDEFEEQHKIESPVRPKKRRRTDSSLVEPKLLKSVQGPMIDSQKEFPLNCITEQFEGSWKGFELQNRWNKPIILKGWTLSDTTKTSSLPLPEKKIDPGEIIRVCLNEKKKEESDLVWKGLKFKKGDKHELWVNDNLGFRHKITAVTLPTNSAGFVK